MRLPTTFIFLFASTFCFSQKEKELTISINGGCQTCECTLITIWYWRGEAYRDTLIKSRKICEEKNFSYMFGCYTQLKASYPKSSGAIIVIFENTCGMYGNFTLTNIKNKSQLLIGAEGTNIYFRFDNRKSKLLKK